MITLQLSQMDEHRFYHFEKEGPALSDDQARLSGRQRALSQNPPRIRGLVGYRENAGLILGRTAQLAGVTYFVPTLGEWPGLDAEFTVEPTEHMATPRAPFREMQPMAEDADEALLRAVLKSSGLRATYRPDFVAVLAQGDVAAAIDQFLRRGGLDLVTEGQAAHGCPACGAPRVSAAEREQRLEWLDADLAEDLDDDPA